MANQLPDQTILRELLDYDLDTGVLTWRHRARVWFKTDRDYGTWNTRFAGKQAFTAIHSEGYLFGTFLGMKSVRAHRVIWKWMTGRDAEYIDHESHDRSDNRWNNLKEGSHQKNMMNRPKRVNNTSGYQGVSYSRRLKKFVCGIRHQGKRIHLGVFETALDAHQAYQAAKSTYDYHPNHGVGNSHA